MNSICRLCLCKSQDCVSLLENNGNQIIESLTSIKIQRSDNLPLGACSTCWENIKLAYRIQQVILECDKKLRLGYCPKTSGYDQLLSIETENALSAFKDELQDENMIEILMTKKLEDVDFSEEESDILINVSITPFIAKYTNCDDETSELDEHLNNKISDKSKEQVSVNQYLEMKYKCNFCNAKFNSKWSVNNHSVLTHRASMLFPCSACSRKFPWHTFEDHAKTHSDQTFICHICGISKKYYYALKRHLETTHAKLKKTTERGGQATNSASDETDESTEQGPVNQKPKSNLFKCYLCSATYKTKARVYSHCVIKHRASMLFPCPACSRMLPLHAFDEHVKTHSDQSYICHICGISVKYYHGLKRHLEATHGSVKKPSELSEQLNNEQAPVNQGPEIDLFKCNLCSAKFKTKWSVNNHSVLTHHASMLFQCPSCPRRFPSHTFEAHTKTHLDHMYICHICGAVLKHHRGLRRHLNVTHGSVKWTIKCEFCDKTFSSNQNCKVHMATHHNGLPNHICHVCGKTFYIRAHLTRHLEMTHLKLRPFSCNYCDKKFHNKFLLRTHLRQHTNDTPFRCDECGEAFKHNVSLKTHKKSKHNIEEEKTVCCSICGKAFASHMAVSCHMKKHNK